MEQNFRIKKGLTLGDGCSGNKSIEVDIGLANSPSIRFNDITNAWEYSNDGILFKEFSVSGGTSAPSDVADVTSSAKYNTIKVSWTDPADIEYDGNTIVAWKGTKLVGKVGSYPTNVSDGTVFIDSTTRDLYKSNGYTIMNLLDNSTYYFQLFPYDSVDGYNGNAVNRFTQTTEVYPILDLNTSEVSKSAKYNTIKVSWTDPADIEYDGNTIVAWKGTKLVGKVGSYPANVSDGTVFIDSTTRDAYKVNNMNIAGLSYDSTYYFQLFPYDSNEVPNNNTSNRFTQATEVYPILSLNATSISSTSDINSIVIKWTDPADIEYDGNTIVAWKGTKLVMKQGSYPTNVSDGTLVVDSTTRNAYKTTGRTITGLNDGTTYYFQLFPYDNADVVNTNTSNRFFKATESLTTIYTANIDTTNSNPETSVTYADNAIGMTAGSSDWDTIFGHYPVILKNGVETVRLNPNDYTKDINGNTVNLADGNVGDVMIAFPRRGIKIETIGNIVRVQMTTEDNKEGFSYLAHQRGSTNKDVFYLGAYKGYLDNNKLRSWSGKTPTANKKIGEFRGYAQALGTGYEQSGFYQLLYRQVMYILKYKNLDSQSVIGRGYVDGNSAVTNTGQLNTKGLDWGENTGKQQMKLFGIEDFYGNIYEWIDGLVTDGSYNILTATTNFNDTGTEYNSYASGINSNTGGFMSVPQGNSECGFVLKSKDNGANNKYFCDYGYLYANRVARFGGIWSDGSGAGAFCLLLYDATSAALSNRGARIMFL